MNAAYLMAQLDAAEEAGENKRLIERSRGIAYMGLTEYEEAIGAFEQALQESNGWLENAVHEHRKEH